MIRRATLIVVSMTLLAAVLSASAAGAAVAQLDSSATAGKTASRERIQSFVIGQSVLGRDIVAYRMGTDSGRVALVVGNTHGDEPKGADVTRALRLIGAPEGVDLWIVDTINPDGLAANTRTNARGVDINRNFAWNWGYIPPSSTNGQYSGEAPADQPETQAIQNLISLIRPAVTIWYHQAANRVSAGGARPEIPHEYARLVGQLIADTPCTAGCTGTGTQFANHTVAGGTAFLVELPSSAVVGPATVQRHAEAVVAVIAL